MKSLLSAILLTTATIAAGQGLPDEATLERASQLARELIITDGHVDLPYRLQTINFRLEKEYLGIPIASEKGDFDYVRAKKGGLDAPFMSIFIPANYQEGADGGATQLADELIGMVTGIIDAHPDKFGHGRSPGEVEQNFKKGLVSLAMGMENGAPILTLEDVQLYFDKGIRYVTLTHSKVNHICDSSYDEERKWNGLSPFGREVVAEMNRVGMMIDISHVSDEAFYQVMELTEVPVIASHSSCRKFTPGFERNMDDDMLKALAENGGVIQINFGSTFLDASITSQNSAMREELNRILEEKGLTADDQDAQPIIEDFRRENPKLYADVHTVADHIDHAVAIAGIDHVGLGSDFDGVGDSLPTGLKDASQYPNLIAVLLQRGYSETDIAKICWGNVERVWRTVEDHASQAR